MAGRRLPRAIQTNPATRYKFRRVATGAHDPRMP